MDTDERANHVIAECLIQLGGLDEQSAQELSSVIAERIAAAGLMFCRHPEN